MPNVNGVYAANPQVAKRRAKEAADDAKHKEKKGRLKGIHIKVLENGYTVACEHESAEKRDKHGCLPWEPPSEYGYETADSVIGFVASKLKAKK